MNCNAPIVLEELAAYWMGELPAGREEALEEHFFGCAHCAGRLEQLAALAHGVRAAVREGRVSMVVTEPFVEAMRRSGLRLREYRLAPGEAVDCTILAGDDAVVSRLRAPLAGVKRLDLVREPGGDAPASRLADVPFDAEAGEVLVLPSAAWLKTMPAFTMRMRLVAVDESGDSPVSEYTFRHSPSPQHAG